MLSLFSKKNIVQNLDSDTFEKMIQETEDAIILDVRTEEEYNQVRIPKSVLIDIYKTDFLNQIEKLDKEKTYFVYCRSGSRSYNAAVQMQRMGFQKVYNLGNGIIEWYGPVESN